LLDDVMGLKGNDETGQTGHKNEKRQYRKPDTTQFSALCP
jgi:hypothetical protein